MRAVSRAARSTLAEFLGDAVVYRSLDPLDRRLPRYVDVARRVGLMPDAVPRKSDPVYARIVVEIVRAAARLAGGGAVERLLFVGDTPGNDATAFRRICVTGGWPGIGFIGSDDPAVPAKWDSARDGDRTLLFATRWRLLDDLDRLCEQEQFAIDGRTAVLVDIDKTAIGARGRNDGAIDRARLDAVLRTIEGMSDAAPDANDVRRVYERINRPSFHRLTGDSQDIVALLTVAVIVGTIPEGILAEDDAAPKLPDLLALAVDRATVGPPEVCDLLRRFAEAAAAGTTPEFETFRRNEYLATVERMVPGSDPMQMPEEITITAEVRAAALRWRDRGALVLGLSDKPDAASRPTDALAALGYLPLHRTEARVVGG